MMTEDRLNDFRLAATKVRVVRDADPANDVVGIVVAWDDEHVLIRRQNRRVRKLSRDYLIQPFDQPREDLLQP
ncbi:hypothetical protein [Marinicrinis sediminis]|uniref:NUDIX hydrolase n=1 Tax=Marinicrinis sediminis TaxID=1652465 RepID=A0ABW5R6E1_9BACL